MAKKKVVAASVLSTEAFPTVGLTIQLEVPTVAANIPSPKLGEECCKSGLDAPTGGGSSQYPLRSDGDPYPARGSGGDHVEVC
jgi:hypothetical protein